MRFTRRDTIKLLGYSAAWAGTRGAFGQAEATLPLTSGPYKGTRGSLDAYRVPSGSATPSSASGPIGDRSPA